MTKIIAYCALFWIIVFTVVSFSCKNAGKPGWHKHLKVEVHTQYWHGEVYEMAPNDSTVLFYQPYYEDESGRTVFIPEDSVRIVIEEVKQ